VDPEKMTGKRSLLEVLLRLIPMEGKEARLSGRRS
jgi:hypothetical protein